MKKSTLSVSRSVMITITLISIFSLTNSCSKTTSTPGLNEVFIQGNAFTPHTITVTAGTTITWTNKDGIAHTVTSTTAGQFDSGSIGSNVSWPHTFPTAGTYSYKCTIHPNMTGTVIVN